jgi:DNA-binding FadR family transcriptional regulator
VPNKTELIFGSLLTRILRGDFADGRLPREIDLAAEYGVARHTARTAVQALTRHGVVSVTHGVAGATIGTPDGWDLFNVELLAPMLAGTAGAALLAEALEIRLLVDPLAAGLAAERASEADLAVLREALAALRSAADATVPQLPGMGTQATPETEFHRAVLRAAGNRFVARAMLPLELVLAASSTGRGATATQAQERIFAAIEAKDAGGAEQAMRDRLEALAGGLPAHH